MVGWSGSGLSLVYGLSLGSLFSLGSGFSLRSGFSLVVRCVLYICPRLMRKQFQVRS